MDANDFHSLVDSLNDAATGADFSSILANFSTDVLQVATNALGNSSFNALELIQNDMMPNSTVELQCLQQADLAPSTEMKDEHGIVKTYYTKDNTLLPNQSCPYYFDSVLCWPKTAAGTWAILPCFEEFKGVHYDSTQNATRFCHTNGTWDNYSNYDKCHHAVSISVPEFSVSELPTYVYCVGYLISLTALTLALIVFLWFKDLKCLRNTIHANLFSTYILSALLWILLLFLQVMTDESNKAECITLVMMFHYFNLTNFFWMFVEGLYLYTLVVQTFSSENIHFVMYACIGWGCPAIIVMIWSIAKIFATPLSNANFNGLDIVCSWMRESHIDWICHGPAALVLILNLIFLIRIMWVLITKLRSANTLETRQYHKASKALLVLIPLFGITYLLVLTGPEHGLSRNVFEIVRAFLLSIQGFFVSLFFCFFNSEVRQALKHRFDRWRDSRNIRRGNSYRNRRSRLSKEDYSQRSRTESLRLTSTSPGNGMNGFSE